MRPDEVLAAARAYDEADPIRAYREHFLIDDPDLIYLDGNSLGRLPKRTLKLMKKVVERQWGGGLVRSWNEHWIGKPREIGDKIARLVGAQTGEVLICDSTSVNLYKLVMAALEARPDRSVILTDSANFPSDLYVLQGCARQKGRALMIVEPHHVEQSLGRETALLALSHTGFKSGNVHSLSRLTSAAHSVGALALWDLCHSVGVMPVDLNGARADLAVGCTYKYLNGGPGAPAFLYIRRDLQEELANPIWGWFGQRDPFAFSPDYSPAEGLQSFASGTPPVLSLLPVEVGVDLVLEAGIEAIREKSVKLTEFLIQLWQELLQEFGVRLNSLRNPEVRGSHVSFGHPDAYRIDQALIHDMKVIPDFREPDNIRFGVSPLYTSFTEVAEGALRLRRVLVDRLYENHRMRGNEVT